MILIAPRQDPPHASAYRGHVYSKASLLGHIHETRPEYERITPHFGAAISPHLIGLLHVKVSSPLNGSFLGCVIEYLTGGGVHRGRSQQTCEFFHFHLLTSQGQASSPTACSAFKDWCGNHSRSQHCQIHLKYYGRHLASSMRKPEPGSAPRSIVSLRICSAGSTLSTLRFTIQRPSR